MADRKKLSGAQYRKRKADREIELSKLNWSIEKFLRPPESSLETTEASTSTSEKDDDIGLPDKDIEVNSREQEEHVVVDTAKDSLENEDGDQSKRPKITEESVKIDYSDPASWEDLPISGDQLVENGPKQVSKKFSLDERKSKFSAVHYKRKLPNGEEVYREYLQYFVSTDKVTVFAATYLAEIQVQVQVSLKMNATIGITYQRFCLHTKRVLNILPTSITGRAPPLYTLEGPPVYKSITRRNYR